MVKLPIRNYTSTNLTLFIEPYCDQYEIPPQGEAIVIVDDGEAHSLDFHPENWVSLWNVGESDAVVEVVSKEQNTVVDALGIMRVWLHQYGAEGLNAVRDLDEAIDREEKAVGYLRARFAVYRALREGFGRRQRRFSRTAPRFPSRGAVRPFQALTVPAVWLRIPTIGPGSTLS